MATLSIPNAIMQSLRNKQDAVDFENLNALNSKLKLNMLKTIQNAQTGHLGACCSSTELFSALYFTDILNIDSKNPRNPDRDYVLVRGHVGPLRYNLFSMLGWMNEDEMSHYREYGTRLQGHEDMNTTPGVDLTPSGSLGMLLSYAVGARYSFKERKLKNRIFCFLGDGEEQEGNISEAARHAANLKLDNLIVIIDKNKKQLSTSTKTVDAADLSTVWKGYGWKVLEIGNGHDLREVYNSYKKAIHESHNGPVCIIAHTIKGNGIRGAIEHRTGYHVFHNSSADDTTQEFMPIEDTINELSQTMDGLKVSIPCKSIAPSNHTFIQQVNPIPELQAAFQPEEKLQYHYLTEFLTKLSEYGKKTPIYVLTADYPPRPLVYEGGFSIPNLKYCNVGIREQHLLGMVHGIRTVERNAEIIVLCGDAFLYRFADQMNVLAQSKDKVTLISVEAGISGARNGSTHQSSGQPGIVTTMPGIKMLEPASGLDFTYALNYSLHVDGPTYVRMNKAFTPFDYGGFRKGPFYEIPITSNIPDLTMVSSGMLVREVFGAAKMLESSGINARVLNVINPKELFGISELIVQGKPLFIYYNGNPLILSTSITRELVKGNKMPSGLFENGFELGTTGSITDLMKHFGLDKESIVQNVTSILRA
ncbi:MAG: thiamine pyrophosphate-dependent enzyme [Candidatus Micrarchaeaceae archaeon]